MSSSRGRGSGGGPKAHVSTVERAEPAFLQRLKQQMGYKEPVTIDAKREQLERLEDADDNDDDPLKASTSTESGPLIVQVNEGDLSAEDVEKMRQAETAAEEKRKIDEGKITFKKPEKRKLNEEKATENRADAARTAKQNRENVENVSKPTDSRLLSFDEDEDD